MKNKSDLVHQSVIMQKINPVVYRNVSLLKSVISFQIHLRICHAAILVKKYRFYKNILLPTNDIQIKSLQKIQNR